MLKSTALTQLLLSASPSLNTPNSTWLSPASSVIVPARARVWGFLTRQL